MQRAIKPGSFKHKILPLGSCAPLTLCKLFTVVELENCSAGEMLSLWNAGLPAERFSPVALNAEKLAHTLHGVSSYSAPHAACTGLEIRESTTDY